MMKAFSGAVFISAALVLTGCGGGDSLSGVYRGESGYGKPTFLLNINGDGAQTILVNKSTGELEGTPTDFDVNYKNGKILLDSSDDVHLSFKMADDERGLTCINCRELLGLTADWKFLKSEPIDIDSVMEKQQEKRQAVKEAEVKRRAEVAKLKKFQGDWISVRVYKDFPLFIHSISPYEGVKFHSFNYDTAKKLNEFDSNFKVDGDKLSFPPGDGSESQIYVLEEDGKKLNCINCDTPDFMLKADPDRVDDINYAREIAGDPQKNSWD